MCPLPWPMNMSCFKFSKIAYNAARVTILGHTSWCTCVCFSRMFLAWNCSLSYPILQFLRYFPVSSFFFFFKDFLFIWLCQVLIEACDILVSSPGIKPGPRAMGAWSLSHWTTRKAPQLVLEVPTYFSSLFHPNPHPQLTTFGSYRPFFSSFTICTPSRGLRICYFSLLRTLPPHSA